MEKIPKIFNLDKSEIEEILKISETKIFYKDEVVYRVGETAQDIYILLEGCLKIMFMGQEIGRVYPIHFIGEMSVFTDNPRSATITSLTEVTLLQMTKDNLFMLFERDKDLQIQFQNYIINDISEKICLTNEMVAKLHSKNKNHQAIPKSRFDIS